MSGQVDEVVSNPNPNLPPLGPWFESPGALCGLGFQSLLDCMGFPWNIYLGFSSHRSRFGVTLFAPYLKQANTFDRVFSVTKKLIEDTRQVCT